MNLVWIDWSIVAFIFAVMVCGVILSRSQMKSVVDFLSAGRSAGRYLVCVAQGIAGIGAITVLANFEMNFTAGFTMAWWGLSMGVVILIVTVSGFVAYRFRQTRALTMAQFFEMRYSKRFRIFAGFIAFFAGLINFGIFPAVGARFFIYFCGLPQTVPILGLEVSTLALTMVVLISVSLYFVFSGGQVSVIITDFIQGTFVNFVAVILVIYFVATFDFNQIYEALRIAPKDASLLDPYKTSAAEGFNLWYYLIGVFGFVYVVLSWQGTQAYNSSAKSAHEAKMGGVLTGWRGFPLALMFLVIPICAYTMMHHASFSEQAGAVNAVLSGIDNEAVHSQLKTPLVMKELLPAGLMGAFVAVMLAAFVSTHDSYLHSWGSILVQDFILPLRGKPLDPKKHLLLLRCAILFVAVFIFFFSLLFQETEYIMMFLAATGAIFAGGSGSVIIGGLYWKRGTTAAAWTAMITGSTLAVSGIVVQKLVPDFPVNGQVIWFIAMAGSITLYIVVSLLGRGEAFDMDRLLKRGKHRVRDEFKVVDEAPSRGFRMLGMGKEFTRGDKVIYLMSYGWTLSWTVVFIAGTIYALVNGIPDEKWMRFWYLYILLQLGIAVIVTVWFTVGGIRDIRSMFRRLGSMNRDTTDDGTQMH